MNVNSVNTATAAVVSLAWTIDVVDEVRVRGELPPPRTLPAEQLDGRDVTDVAERRATQPPTRCSGYVGHRPSPVIWSTLPVMVTTYAVSLMISNVVGWSRPATTLWN